MPLTVRNQRIRAWVLAACPLLAWIATISSHATLAQEGSAASAPVPKIYHKARNFRIPFNLNPDGRDRVKELHLLVSEDQGYHWRAISKTFPDHPTFTFRSSHDGEYWFAVQTRTVDGKVSPMLDATIEPNLKVVVDSFPPSLLLEPDGRRGSVAAVRWEVKDENLDLKSLVLEYQVDGAGAWRRVPIGRARLIGGQRWDAGTAEAIKVRASVADKAGNVTEASVELPEGTSSPLDLDARDRGDDGPPSIAQISSGAESDVMAGPGFTPVNRQRSPNRRSPSAPVRRAPRGREQDDSPPDSRPGAPEWSRDSAANGVQPRGRSAGDLSPTDLFAAGASPLVPGGLDSRRDETSTPTPTPTGAMPSAQPSGRENGNSLLVSSPKFKLQYAVDDAGPNGPATVELWITQDGGRTWIRRGDDSDRVSPIEVDLGGEGTYGICLVARSAAGLGDQPPAPGDPPQSWVEVDGTPPLVQLQPPQVGTGVNSGKVAIAWRASDLHLPPRSVLLSWRPDQGGAAWQTIAEGQDNVGQYVWTVPATAPQRFHLKVEAVDSVGHHGAAETTEMGAIMVDRSRPRSRIIGLDPNARAGIGEGGRSLR
jgi:hypothetical protein